MSLRPFPRAGGNSANHIALTEVRPLLFFVKLVHRTYMYMYMYDSTVLLSTAHELSYMYMINNVHEQSSI